MWIVDAMNAAAEKAGPADAGSRIRTWRMEDMNLVQATWIGAAKFFRRFSRDVALNVHHHRRTNSQECPAPQHWNFLFFLSMPTMAAATCYDLLKSVMGKGETRSAFRTSIPTAGLSWPSVSSVSFPWPGPP